MKRIRKDSELTPNELKKREKEREKRKIRKLNNNGFSRPTNSEEPVEIIIPPDVGPIVSLLPDTRKHHLYPTMDLQSLGRLARVCRCFYMELAQNSKSFNWLPASWRDRWENFKLRATPDAQVIQSGFRFFIHDFVRPADYFSIIPDVGRYNVDNQLTICDLSAKAIEFRFRGPSPGLSYWDYCLRVFISDDNCKWSSGTKIRKNQEEFRKVVLAFAECSKKKQKEKQAKLIIERELAKRKAYEQKARDVAYNIKCPKEWKTELKEREDKQASAETKLQDWSWELRQFSTYPLKDLIKKAESYAALATSLLGNKERIKELMDQIDAFVQARVNKAMKRYDPETGQAKVKEKKKHKEEKKD